MDEIIIQLLSELSSNGRDVDLYLKVSDFHVLDASLEMHGIRVIEEDVFFGEEDEGGTHEDVYGTLCPRIVDEIVANEEGELT